MIPPRKLRSLNPGAYDRIIHLLEITTLDDPVKVSNLMKLLIVKQVESSITDLETYLLKKSKYNFVIKNVPQFAVLNVSGTETNVSYINMRETIGQFGKISSMHMSHGVAYFEMKNGVETHKLLNGMKIGKNIITTSVF